MPRYKLIYFDFKGRGEPIRLMFAAAGVKYEDCRVTGEEYMELKCSKFLIETFIENVGSICTNFYLSAILRPASHVKTTILIRMYHKIN